MRQSRLSGSVEGVMGNHDSYSDFVFSTISSCELNRRASEIFAFSACFEPTQALQSECGSSEKSRPRGDDVNRHPFH
jgi:hypothetical protein